MWENIEALIPPFVVAAAFIAGAIAIFRALDGRKNGDD